MFTVKYTPQFTAFLASVKDGMTKARLQTRLRKVSLGLLGDVAPVGEGVFELREHFGAGWRMYYVQHGNELIVMLGGGNKAKQQQDINEAIALAKQLED
jgi:putative addiction module killer protein